MSSEPKSAEGARELGNGVRTPTSRVADGSHGDHGHQCLNYLEHQPKSAWMVLTQVRFRLDTDKPSAVAGRAR